MTTPLNRDIRKALVKLAEKNPDYRQSARIVLGLDAGRPVEQIAQALRVSVQEVEEWRERFAAEGVAIFRDVLPSGLIDVVATQEESTPPPATPDETIDDFAPAPPQQNNVVENTPIETSPKPADDLAEAASAEKPGHVEASTWSPPPRRIKQPQRGTTKTFARPRPRKPELEQTLPDNAPDPTQPISIGALAAAFDVDMRYANHISQQARELFDLTASYHRLPGHLRNLLHAAALLQNIGAGLSAEDYAVRGRDIVLHYDFKEISKDERQILASIIGLQLPSAVSKQDSAFKDLPEGMDRSTEMLIGLFRIVLGLTASNAQQSSILETRETPGEITIVLSGASADSDAEQALQNAELWNSLYGMPQLRFVTEEEAENDVTDLPRWARLRHFDSSVEVSNALREHYALRFDYLAERIRRNESGLLVAVWREFQRLSGVWLWLLPGTKPRQVFGEDTEWLGNLIQTALFYATLEDRTDGLLNETDSSKDDPQAIRELKTLSVYHAEQAANAFEELRSALRGRRYSRWLNSIRMEIKDETDTVTFGSQVGVRAWAYLSELRQVIDHVNASGMNADLEQLLTLETVETFEVDLRLLTDLLVYSASLLGVEIEQVLQVLEPLSAFVQAWQRMEHVAQYAEQIQKVPPIELSDFVLQAFSIITRDRANEMRWNLVDMWEPLETLTFRRALALAVAKP